jgi:iron complex transport system substrate-binding protein
MRTAHRSHALALCASLLLATVSRAATPDFAHMSSGPRRIVSTFLCTDEYVYRLVPRDRIAALSYLAGDTHPVVSTIADKVKGIPLVRASAESVLALKPDLVITYQATNARLRQQLTDAGVKVFEVPWASSLADIRRITRLLGSRLNARERADALIAEMNARLVAAHVQAPDPPVRALIYEPNGYATTGGVTDEILSAGGLRDVAVGMKPTASGTLPVEAVLAAAPELLILNGENESRPARADLVLRHPALKALRARSLIAHASLTPLLCPGPWSTDVAGAFASLGQKARARTESRAHP